MIPFGPTVDLHISVIGESDSLNLCVSVVKSSPPGIGFSILWAISISLCKLHGHITVNGYRICLHYLFYFLLKTVGIC